jgi:hypothetical protein
MKHIALIIFLIALFGCADKKTLPPQELVDIIRVEQNHPENELVVITDKEKIQAVVDFINKKKSGWSVPWYGSPVGQVYLELYKNEKFVGNFYVGPNFFGRDLGNFWSQPASKNEIAELGSILGINSLTIIGS